MSTASPPASVGGLLIHWARTRPLELLPPIGLLVAVVSFAIVAIQGIARGSGNVLFMELLAHTYVIVWLLLASISVRTIGVRDTVAAFFSGFFFSTALTWLIVRPLRELIGNSTISATWIAPPVEEIAKTLPLLLILWAYHRRHYRKHGLTDLVVLGFAVGAGMSVHEDVLYGRTFSTFVDSSVGLIFPSFFQAGAMSHDFFGNAGGGLPVFTLVSHAGWGLILGFGFGLASIYHRKRTLALSFALGSLLLTTVDHAVFNYSVDVPTWLPRLLLDHNLLVILIVLIIPAAIIYDTMRRDHRPPALPKPKLSLSWRTFRNWGKGFAGITAVLAMGHYRRSWNALAYARQSNPELPNGADDRQLRAHLAIAFPSSSRDIS